MNHLMENNIKDYYKEKKKNIGFALFLENLFVINLFDFNLLNTCIYELIYNDKNMYNIEIGVKIIKNLYNN